MENSAESAFKEPSNRFELIRAVNRRIFCLLMVLGIFLFIYLLIMFYLRSYLPLLPLVALAGLTGGFLGIQRRINNLDKTELKLLADSWLATSLPAVYGGILAIILYMFFMSEIVSSPLFPEFTSTLEDGESASNGIESIVKTKVKTYQDAARLVFWSFVAGYSERFVPLLVESAESKGRLSK